MGAPPNEDQIADMLDDPAVAQQMAQALNNPAVIEQMIQMNPMLQNNPQAREMLTSPFFRNMLTNPEMLRSVAAMRRNMGGGAAGAAAFPAPGAVDNTPGGAPAAGAQGGANNAAAQQNPFAGLGGGLFGMPAAGAGAGAPNPFLALLNPAAGQAPGAAPAGLFGQADQGGAAGAAGAADNPFGLTPAMMQEAAAMFGGGGGLGGLGGFGAPAAPADTRPPEERYADQLQQLNEMGFFDFDQNVAALRRSGGNVQGAVNFLLGA